MWSVASLSEGLRCGSCSVDTRLPTGVEAQAPVVQSLQQMEAASLERR